MKHNNHFGMAFRTARLAQGLTQEDFATESGRTYISELERYVKYPTLQKIDELAARLGVHPLTVLALSYASKPLVQTQRDKSAGVDKLLENIVREVEELLQRAPQP